MKKESDVIIPPTAFEQACEARSALVCEEYRGLRAKLPGASAHRLFKVIAEKHGLTAMGVRGIVIKAGLYSKKDSKI